MQYSVTYREKNGGIQVIVRYKNNSGQWKQKAKQGISKKSLAKIEANKIIDELKANEDFDEDFNDLTLGLLKKEYLERTKLLREPATYINYAQCLDHYSSLDEIPISRLKVIDVQKCVNRMVLKKLSHTTLQRFTSIFKSFIKWVGISYNVKVPILASITIPSCKSKIEKKVINSKDLGILIAFYRDRQSLSLDYYIAVLIASKAGLRVGEIMGLTWDDIDFEKCSISVNKQWKILKETDSYGFGELKSKNSYRSIPVSPIVIKELQLIKGISSINFNRRILNASSTSSLTVNLDKTLKKHFGITIHELRHTYATYLISSGLDFKTTAKLLGHDVEQTMRVYSHVTSDMLDSARILINAHIN